MQNNTLIVAIITLFIGFVGGYLLANNNQDTSNSTSKLDSDIPTGMHRMPDGSLMRHDDDDEDAGMMGMGNMGHGMMMVGSEKEFITEMIPHHQEAVDTAKEVLARGATTPEIKTLMENIVTAQEKEIADMKVWYEKWYGTPYQPSGKYEPMMRDLSNLSGADLDKAFLEDMVMHHMGAIMMAHSVQGNIEHEEIEKLTDAIIKTQSEEIQLMRKLRAGL